jgi:hypothetical protein
LATSIFCIRHQRVGGTLCLGATGGVQSSRRATGGIAPALRGGAMSISRARAMRSTGMELFGVPETRWR